MSDATQDVSIQVRDCLNSATHENGYEHEWGRDPEELVREIHDWHGLEAFDPDNTAEMSLAILSVVTWRETNGMLEVTS